MTRLAVLILAATILASATALPIAGRQQLELQDPFVAGLEPSAEPSAEPLFPSPSPPIVVTGASSPAPSPAPPTTVPGKDPAPSSNIPPPGTVQETKPSLNEGCVAVEHLKGYVLQHREHLLRPVLCAHGFCATPNHAIVVDGAMTSMKQLCANEWECVEAVKLVNNLNIFANRRAVINEHITVTPYDLRFPKAASWVAQTAEAIWNLVSSSVGLGAVLMFAVLSMQRSNKI